MSSRKSLEVIPIHPILLFILIILAPLFIMILAQLASEIHYRIYAARTLYRPIPRAPKFNAFTIADPYNFPGEYRKAQLHLHTSNSKDVQPKLPVAHTIDKYRQRAYQYLVITDHELVTDCSDFNTPGLTVIPGVEETIPFIFWPLGKHLVRIGAVESGAGSKFTSLLDLPAHPNWQGNLGTGRWYLQDLLQFPNLKLLEIYNHHSNPAADTQLWSQLLHKRGYQNPVWAVAVDDSDNGENIDQGWIMVKTPDITINSLIEALTRGSFYATTGIIADFWVEDPKIRITTENGTEIRIINQQNRVIVHSQTNSISYQPKGDEGFIRIEVTNPQGMTAWSQPFFLIPADCS